MTLPPALSYLIEPRFSGGTSAAVAAELRALAGHVPIRVNLFASRLFPDAPVAPVLRATIEELNLAATCADPGAPIGADVVILHNPAFLKSETGPLPPITCRDLVVVTHENFLRPGGAEGFDVARALDLVDRHSVCLRKWLAPVSARNRRSVLDWLSTRGGAQWRLTDADWHNVFDAPCLPPSATPGDRRGRLSRPGREKFPSVTDLDLSFPPHAQTNLILGADLLIAERIHRPHWTLHPFGGLPVARFFRDIDFLVHFTASGWAESFGRVVAEAIAAGKLVLTDPDTAAGFDGGVVGCRPADADTIIASYLADPHAYRDAVLRGQAGLRRFAPDAFRARFLDQFGRGERAAA